MYTLEKFEKRIPVEDYIRDYVNVQEFLDCCRKCPAFDKVWSCPGFDFEPEDYWRAYDSFYILGYKINFEGAVSEERSLEILAEVKDKVSEELFEMESARPGSVSLSAGSCSVCGKGNCTKPLGRPCRYPEKMRHSIESLGGNVGKTVHDLLGIELEWIEEGKAPSYFVLVGGLLEKQSAKG